MKPCLNGGQEPQPLYRQEKMELDYPESPNSHRRAYQDMRRDQRTNLRGFASKEEFAQFARRYMDKAFMTEQARIAASNIDRVSNLGNLIAQYSPAWLSPDAPVRNLRDWLVDSQAAGRNIFDTAEFWSRDMGQSAARFQFTKAIDDAYADFVDVAKHHNLTKDQLDRLWFDMNELGNRARLMRFNGANEFSYKASQRKYEKLIERAKEMGFSDDEIATMARAAEKHTGVYDVMKGVGNVVGTNIEQTPGLGYIPRQMTDDASFILRRHKARELGLETHQTRNIVGQAAALKSRETFEFYVDDLLLYADAVGVKFPEPPARVRDAVGRTRKQVDEYAQKVANRPQGRTDAQHAKMVARLDELENKATEAARKLQEFEDKALGAVAEHFTDERKLIDDIMNKMDKGDLDRLVDTGVIGKAPMTTTQVYDLLKQAYGKEMPLRGIADLVETDPIRSFRKYKQGMREALGASQVVNEIHVNGVELGLAAPPAKFNENPGQYQGWRRMDDLLQKYEINPTNKAAGKTRLHPYVYDQLDAMFKLASEPAAQGAVARWISETVSFFKRGVLGTFEFVNRNMIEVALQSWRAGTNLANLTPASQYYRDFLRYGPDALPDEKLFANGTLSVRDIMEYAVQTGRMSLTSPIDGVQIARRGRTDTERMVNMIDHAANPNAALNVKNIKPFVERLMAQTQHSGIIDGVRFAARGFSRAQTEWFSKLLMPLAHAQDAALLANYMTTLADGRWNRVGQFFSTGSAAKFHFDNIRDAAKHADEYIYRYQTGIADRTIKQYVPFWSYMSNAMPATLRGMARNPAQYLAYQRLYAAINGDARRDEEFTQAATPPWFGGQTPIVFRDPEGREGMWFSVDMQRLDPFYDLMGRLSRTSDMIGRMRGSNTGSFRDKINQVGGLDDGNFFSEFMRNNENPISATIYATRTGKHPFFDREFSDSEELFGLEMTGKGLWSGGYRRFLLDTWMPQLRWVEKQGQLLLPGVAPTEMGPDGVERVDPRYTNLYLRALNSLGFTTTTIDIHRGLQRTEAHMMSVGYQLQDEIRMMEGRAKAEPDPQKREELMLEAAKLDALRQQVMMVSEEAAEANRERGRMTHSERREAMRAVSQDNSDRYFEMQEEINK